MLTSSLLMLNASRACLIFPQLSRYGRLSGMSILVARDGKVAHLSHRGVRSLEDDGLEIDDSAISGLFNDQADYLGRHYDAL